MAALQMAATRSNTDVPGSGTATTGAKAGETVKIAAGLDPTVRELPSAKADGLPSSKIPPVTEVPPV